jgi:transcription elongation factor Elf1
MFGNGRRMVAADRTVSRCVVCGSREVRTDAVEQRGWVLLAECPHCDHRWTQTLPEAEAKPRGTVRVPPSAPRRPEVASAA